ncbi:MAG: hypothetical protein ACLT3Y_10230 [Ruminococcus callidus]
MRIYEYTLGFIHAKAICRYRSALQERSTDYRSLYLHMECAAMLVECSVAEDEAGCVVTIEKAAVDAQTASVAGTVCSGRDPADDQPAL